MTWLLFSFIYFINSFQLNIVYTYKSMTRYYSKGHFQATFIHLNYHKEVIIGEHNNILKVT